MKAKLSFEEQELIKVHYAQGKSFYAISRGMNRSPHTIKKYLLSSPEVQEHVQEIKADLADQFEELSRKMLRSITEADIQKITAYQRTLSAAVATDKMRLLRDQSTENVSVSAQVQELDKSLQDTRSKIAQLAAELNIDAKRA